MPRPRAVALGLPLVFPRLASRRCRDARAQRQAAGPRAWRRRQEQTRRQVTTSDESGPSRRAAAGGARSHSSPPCSILVLPEQKQIRIQALTRPVACHWLHVWLHMQVGARVHDRAVIAPVSMNAGQRRMGVEPTLDRAGGRATVLKTARPTGTRTPPYGDSTI